MLSARFVVLIGVVATMLSACAAEVGRPTPGQPAPAPAVSSPAPFAPSAAEDPDVAQLRELDRRALAGARERGLVYSEPSLERYLDSLTARLAGPNAGFRVIVLRDPMVNAAASS